jgi:hypothetical protein
MGPDIMRRSLAFLIVAAFVAALGAAVVHHHGDGESHADCALCLFLIQPAISGTAADDAHGLPASAENPTVSKPLSAPLWLEAAPLGRAPPYRKA